MVNNESFNKDKLPIEAKLIRIKHGFKRERQTDNQNYGYQTSKQ